MPPSRAVDAKFQSVAAVALSDRYAHQRVTNTPAPARIIDSAMPRLIERAAIAMAGDIVILFSTADDIPAG